MVAQIKNTEETKVAAHKERNGNQNKNMGEVKQRLQHQNNAIKKILEKLNRKTEINP